MMHPSTEFLNTCRSCHFQQDQRYSYCGHCGQCLLNTCGNCRQFSPAYFHFCGYCGFTLNAAAAHQAMHPQQVAPMQAMPPQQVAPMQAMPPQQVAPMQAMPPQQVAPMQAMPPQQVAPMQAMPPQQVAPPEAMPPQQVAPMQAMPPQQVAPPEVMPPQQVALPEAMPPQQVALPQVMPPQQADSSQFAPPTAVARVSERRPVAVLFCDVCGFTAMSEKLDPEEVSDIIQPLFQKCNQAISKYGGVVEKFIGDAIMALFGVPITHEDDPERAAMAALEMRQIIQDFGAELEKKMGFGLNMRIGLNVGMVVAGSVDLDAKGNKNYQVLGDVINTAARMEQNAVPGHILVTDTMYELLKDSFELKADKLITAKGKKEPLQAYELLGVRQLRQRSRGIGITKTPLIGRDDVLQELLQKAQQALNSQSSQMLLVTGDSGLGKTRLAEELFDSLAQVTENASTLRLQGNATSYSQSFSYFMMQSLVRSMLRVDETGSQAEIIETIEAFVQNLQIGNAEMNTRLLTYLLYPHIDMPKLKLIAPDRLQKQIFRAVEDVLLRLATDTGLFLQIDDLQWVDALSLKWLADFQQRLQKTALPIVVVCSSRLQDLPPELEFNWDANFELSPLNQLQSQALMLSVLDMPTDTEVSKSLQSLIDMIVSRAAGNPFYIEEVLRILFDDQLLVNQEGQWKLTCSVKDLPLPNSVQRLIMSRFDRLPEYERQVLQTLSVVGSSVSWEIFEGLIDSPHLDALSHSLLESGFVRINACHHGREFIFNQTLAQEVIYNTLVKRRKNKVHQQIGEILEKLHMSDPSQVLDLLAFHFSRTPELPKAVRYLNLSAEKASRLYANQQANEQYEEILKILEQLEPETLISIDLNQRDWLKASRLQNHVLHKRCELKLLTGAYDEVLALVDKAFERDLSVLEKSRFLYCRGRVLEKRSEFQSAYQVFEEARQLLGGNEPREQARLLNAQAWVSRWMNEYDSALAACQSAIQLLEDHPDMEQIAYAHNVMGVVYFYQHNWDLALEHYQKSLAIQDQIQDLWGHANSLSNIGNVYFMTNRWPEAIEAFDESLALRQQLGDIEGIATSHNNLGHAYQEVGEYATAETHIAQALKAYQELNHSVGEAVALCNLGTVCFRQQQNEIALSHFNTGIALLEEKGMESILPETYNHRIQIHLNEAQWEQARQHLDANRPTIEKYGDPLQKGRLERLEGLYYLKQEAFDQAEVHLNQALEDLQNGDHKAECQKLYEHLSQLYQSKGSDQAEYWQGLARTAP